MRVVILLLSVSFLTACEPPELVAENLDTPDFEGNWYSVRAQGVTTFHSDSTWTRDGEITVRFFTCLSSEQESGHTDVGTWSWANNTLTITLTSSQDDELQGETYTHNYKLLDESFDERLFFSETDEYSFRIWRRWRDTPYDCSTIKADIDADRNAAIADGRFKTVYSDFTGND